MKVPYGLQVYRILNHKSNMDIAASNARINIISVCTATFVRSTNSMGGGGDNSRFVSLTTILKPKMAAKEL